jgi:hypothetical protein
MPEPADLERFVQTLRKSRLITPLVINRLLAEFAASYTRDDQTSASLIDFLVGRGYLNAWHCHKLSEGKFKGFFFPDKHSPTPSTEERYQLIGPLPEHLQTDRFHSKYSAIEIESGREVVLVIRPKGPQSGFVSYDIE